MKIRNLLLIPATLVATLSSLTSCGVDRWPEYAAETELDQWITTVMRDNYLWYTDIPEDKKLNFFKTPEDFLKSIVSKEDNDASYIDTIYQQPLPSYGFDYNLYQAVNNDTAYNALITYVLPNSPANAAGLKRGDWIMEVNDEVITKKSEPKLLNTGLALKLTTGIYTYQTDPETEAQIGVVVKSGTAQIGAEQGVEDNPIHYHSVITTANGIKVGYLVYSHFTAGTEANPQKYNEQLRAISREFATAGITELILDLRYNKGGSLACAQLLCALVAPQSALGTPLGNLTYNDKQVSKDRSLTFDSEVIGSGSNLNISQGFIISSNATSGVSGVMLNLLSPLKRWALVGSSVSCSGVATESFADPTNTWSLNPVVCTVYNSLQESGRGGSFTATKTISETNNLTKFLPFGNPDEMLLSTTIGLIEGTIKPTSSTAQSTTQPVKEVIRTPARKSITGTTIR